MSIKWLFGCIIGLMGLMLIGLSVWPLSTSLVAATSAQRVALLSQVSHDLFDGYQKC